MRLIAMLLLICSLAQAEDYKPKRSKVIDFDGEVVEGINKKSLDSLSQVSEEDKRRRRAHLYRTRKGFKDVNLQFISELRSQ